MQENNIKQSDLVQYHVSIINNYPNEEAAHHYK